MRGQRDPCAGTAGVLAERDSAPVCDNDLGIIKDYWDDQKAADASAPSFARALCRFIEWRNSKLNDPEIDPCLKRISVLAHSMGNRVLRQTLSSWAYYHRKGQVPLLMRNVFMLYE